MGVRERMRGIQEGKLKACVGITTGEVSNILPSHPFCCCIHVTQPHLMPYMCVCPEVFVGCVGSANSRCEYTEYGEKINMAARYMRCPLPLLLMEDVVVVVILVVVVANVLVVVMANVDMLVVLYVMDSDGGCVASSASMNEVLTDEVTQERCLLTSQEIDWDKLKNIKVKGKDNPIPCFR